jgi:hypothetical protein
VTGLEHLQEGQRSLAGLGDRCLGKTSSDLVSAIDPVVIGLGVEVVVASPLRGKNNVRLKQGHNTSVSYLELVGPGLVAHPVADEVDIAGVDEHANVVLQHGG